MTYSSRKFIVCVHDVCPQWHSELKVIFQQLHASIGQSATAAIIPEPFLIGQQADVEAVVTLVKRHASEIVLHGYTHLRSKNNSPLSWLTGNSDELVGLLECQLVERFQQGQAILQKHFGAEAKGFVPPAWRSGRATPSLLRSCNIDYVMTLAAIRGTQGNVRLATWSWDAGVIGSLGYLGEGFGYLLFAYPGSIPCIVLHPRDVQRGLLGRGLARIDALLKHGYCPTSAGNVYHASVA